MVPESHFASVLHTNHVPSTKELAELQVLILEPKERIERLDEEIRRLQAERDELQQFVDDHSALTAPFRRLPADIWGEIFIHCLPTNKLNVALCAAKEHPLLLTTICRAWREVALNTPRLWSALHVHVPGTHPNPTFPARLRGIKSWLDRSGSRPLTLSVSMIDHTPSYLPARTLSLDSGVKASHLRPLERLTKEDLPLLETIYIGKPAFLVAGANPSALPTPPLEDPTSFAKLLPQLSSLRSFHTQPRVPLALDTVSTYRRLTQLTLSSSILPNAALRQIAMSCRVLSTLTLQLFFHSSRENVALSQEAPVDWPSLRELNLQLEGAGYYIGGRNDAPSFHPVLKGTFDSILAPQLCRLFVQFGTFTYRPVEDVVPFQGFIAGSPCLTHLHVQGYNVLDPEALSRCLQFAPSLTALTVRPCTEYFSGLRRLRRLTVIFPSPVWVPKLLSSLNDLGSCPEMKMLDFGGCKPDNINSIVEFVQGEGRSSKLKHLRADLDFLREEEVRAVTSTTLTDTLRSLRETLDILVALEWQVSENAYDPSKGMPIENSPWASDSYHN
ncbi:hypothetical protein PQX77_015936 [Marasmius sp. AFHP31]|nr:hypothetical protein PQX77_015936 [Marasmius sp. AFHP31]